MQKEVEADLNLRQKVATFDGYHDFTTHIPQNRISARESIGGRFVEVPYYELSLTEINLACDRHTIDFTLKTAWKPDGGYEFEAYEESSRTHALGETRAIALCNLFVAVMEARGKGNQAQEDLPLREKVAILGGWSDIQNNGIGGLKGRGSEAHGGSQHYSNIPPYEIDFIWIHKLCLLKDVDHRRSPLSDLVECADGNFSYVNPRTNLIGEGEDPAIALCNLFIAVMESRLAISSSFKVEANNLRTLSESLNLINSQINSSYDRVEAMLDATKEALIEEIERLKRELESLSRR